MQSWSDVYYFCSDPRFCTCDFKWTWLGYLKFLVSEGCARQSYVCGLTCAVHVLPQRAAPRLAPSATRVSGTFADGCVCYSADAVELHLVGRTWRSEACGGLLSGRVAARYSTADWRTSAVSSQAETVSLQTVTFAVNR